MTLVRFTHLAYGSPDEEDVSGNKERVGRDEVYATPDEPLYAWLIDHKNNGSSTFTILGGGTALAQGRVAEYGREMWGGMNPPDVWHIVPDDEEIPSEITTALAEYRLTS